MELPLLSHPQTYNMTERVFVVEVSGRALVAFGAISRREADGLRKEQWFRDELIILRSEGQPIWDGNAPLVVRQAEPNEIDQFETAKLSARNNDSDEMLLAYLIPLDGPR